MALRQRSPLLVLLSRLCPAALGALLAVSCTLTPREWNVEVKTAVDARNEERIVELIRMLDPAVEVKDRRLFWMLRDLTKQYEGALARGEQTDLGHVYFTTAMRVAEAGYPQFTKDVTQGTLAFLINGKRPYLAKSHELIPESLAVEELEKARKVCPICFEQKSMHLLTAVENDRRVTFKYALTHFSPEVTGPECTEENDYGVTAMDLARSKEMAEMLRGRGARVRSADEQRAARQTAKERLAAKREAEEEEARIRRDERRLQEAEERAEAARRDEEERRDQLRREWSRQAQPIAPPVAPNFVLTATPPQPVFVPTPDAPISPPVQAPPPPRAPRELPPCARDPKSACTKPM